ncbi:phosphotransferase enzyme family protein [Paenibacillus sp. 481]|uniref:phosphotransferase enzyme family protein n=1 Tax=Paenibacillus sp. 481 TaxID=2835869 RepID=UPI001E312FC8|nr:phosphotransferase [Paenibacillus sp. 481]UHA73494.1 phosphotransferase [Paenibacillus sp. 481]
MIDSLKWIIAKYVDTNNVKTEPAPFGLTNTTIFVAIHNEKFVVRKYDRYTKSIQSLALEMSVTSFLEDSPLSFEIPRFLPTLDGEAYVTLQDGTLGACVTYIKGTAPALLTLKDARSFGSVVGELAAKLGTYNKPRGLDFEGIPFTDFYGIHPLVNQAAVESFWDCPPFPITDAQKNAYDHALASVNKQLEQLKKLPQQLVHHDLLVFNLLAIDDNITGVLDFDFLAYDIAFLEFAISLNHVLQMSNGSLDMAAAFIDGYTTFRSFTTDETQQLRTLTRLYHVAVLHIYMGQYVSGKDIGMPFTTILNQLIERDYWLDLNLDKLEPLFTCKKKGTHAG